VIIIDDIVDDPERHRLPGDGANFTLNAFMKALAVASTGFQSAPRIVPAQRPFHERYRYKTHNGTQEMARRLKQMNRTKPWKNAYPGVLWAGFDGERYTTDSHGQLCPFYS